MKRYFKTEYQTANQSKVLLHNNDKGNFPDLEWVRQSIKDLNPDTTFVRIGKPIEISKSTYYRLMRNLQDARVQYLDF